MSDDLREELKKAIEESRKDDSRIIKELVVGFLIVKSRVNDDSSYINVIPLNSSWDEFNGDHDLDVNEEIIGVVPAPQGSYKILGLFPCEEDEKSYPEIGEYNALGYEHQGAYFPDWKKLLEETVKNKEYLKSGRHEISIQ